MWTRAELEAWDALEEDYDDYDAYYQPDEGYEILGTQADNIEAESRGTSDPNKLVMERKGPSTPRYRFHGQDKTTEGLVHNDLKLTIVCNDIKLEGTCMLLNCEKIRRQGKYLTTSSIQGFADMEPHTSDLSLSRGILTGATGVPLGSPV